LVGKALYYLFKKDNYLKISTLLICICSVFAVYLNIEGTNCIREINSLALQQNNSTGDNTNNAVSQRNNTGFSRLDQQQQEQERQLQDAMLQQSYELRKHCFLVTNLYVYSLFGVIIGFIVLVIWYTRYKQIWTVRRRHNRDNKDDQIGFR
jgi:predicted PurR-regulated permease PerM